MSRPKFNASRYESSVIQQIALRAVDVAKAAKIEYEYRTAFMDIEACHCNGCPLVLHELLVANDADFSHDIFGIRRHIDRNTGKIDGSFDPRYSLPSPENYAKKEPTETARQPAAGAA